jgi:predicted RNase H-like HicB family nuclease
MKQTYNITVKDNKVINICLPVIFFKSKEYHGRVFAECPALQIITDGKNLEDAKKMFEEALSLWLDYILQERNILQVFKALGWKVSKNSVIPTEALDTSEPVLPIALKSQQLSIPLGA